MANTPYMNLDLPVPSSTVGPDYATKNNDAFETIDAHDHTPGNGQQVPAAGLDIDDNLDFKTNEQDNVGAVNLVNQGASLPASNVQSVYSYSGDLWFNNSAGTPVQITQGNSIASASSPLVPVGVIWPYGGSSAPTGFLLCDGTAVSRTTFSGLFAIIGTTYGVGDGSTTFNLPNLRGRTPIGAGTYTDPVSGSVTRTLGSSAGAEKHVLTTSELAAHNHGGGSHYHAMFRDTNANTGTLSSLLQFVGRALSIGNAADYTLQGSTGTPATVGRTEDPNTTVVQTQGSDVAHNNMQPYIVTNYIIKT